MMRTIDLRVNPPKELHVACSEGDFETVHQWVLTKGPFTELGACPLCSIVMPRSRGLEQHAEEPEPHPMALAT